MRSEDVQCDQELVSLAHETCRVARSIEDMAVRARLIEIADKLLELSNTTVGSD